MNQRLANMGKRNKDEGARGREPTQKKKGGGKKTA